MELTVEKERKPLPYSTAILTIIAGAFFLLGIGIGAFTLNAVEASSRTQNYRLNIAKLAQNQEGSLSIPTDVYLYNVLQGDGSESIVSLEYPKEWSELEQVNSTINKFSGPEGMLFVELFNAEAKTHIETAAMFAELVTDSQDVELMLLDSGETKPQGLVFGLYATEDLTKNMAIAVIDVYQVNPTNKYRIVMATPIEDLATFKALVNRVNVSPAI